MVIGYNFWQKMFGGAPDVGRSFHTDGDPVTVIGVMPRGFRGLRMDDGVDIIAPFGTVIPSPSDSTPGAIRVAALAALLAFVGVYSLFAYAVVRRTREIGGRVAVGTTPGAVVRMVLRESVTLTAIGVALGIPLGITASRGLRALLFGVSESDPLVAALVAVLFLVLTIAAAFIPARRAARLDPVVALRAG